MGERIPIGVTTEGRFVFTEKEPAVEVLWEWPEGTVVEGNPLPLAHRLVCYGGWSGIEILGASGWVSEYTHDDTGFAEELAADLARRLRAAEAALLNAQT